MNERKDRELDRLLARGGVSGAGHDRVFNNVRRITQNEGRPPGLPLWARRLVIAVPVSAALVLASWVLYRPTVSDGANEIRARGAAAPMTVVYHCLSANGEQRRPEGQCKVGDQLHLRVDGAPSAAFLAVWQETPSGPAWLFPDDQGDMPTAPSESSPLSLNRSIAIEDSGPFALRVRAFTEAVSRKEAQQRSPVAEQRLRLSILP